MRKAGPPNPSTSPQDQLVCRLPAWGLDVVRVDTLDLEDWRGAGRGDGVVHGAGGDHRPLQVMRELEVGCGATSLGGVETLESTPFFRVSGGVEP